MTTINPVPRKVAVDKHGINHGGFILNYNIICQHWMLRGERVFLVIISFQFSKPMF